eukprot:TRINITY_DN11600_c0_g1_i1.p1 TRINITY_DN11600_c0_g1~~TRINITY_DN11600_c0_g1_i1.p1  ORF type:complete len:321 (-),score=62.21 TRINITY_DN11600_c0_g1_i1:72-1034(-)
MEEALAYEQSTVTPLEWKREHYAVAASVVIFGGGSLWLLNKLRKEVGRTILPETRACLQQSTGYALASWAIGCAPTFAVRRLGWDFCKPLYKEVLFSNSYTTAASVVLPVALASFAILFSGKKSPTTKKQLWLGSCLSIGTVVAPLFFTPRDTLSIVGGYVLGMTLPVAATICSATNFFMLNFMGLVGLVGGALFMRNTGLPYFLTRRHGRVTLSNLTSLNVAFGTTMMMSLMMLVATNVFVYYVQKSHEDAANPEKKPILLGFDGTDPISNGMVIAGSVGIVFARLLHKLVTFPLRMVRGKKEVPEKNGIAEVFQQLLA